MHDKFEKNRRTSVYYKSSEQSKKQFSNKGKYTQTIKNQGVVGIQLSRARLQPKQPSSWTFFIKKEGILLTQKTAGSKSIVLGPGLNICKCYTCISGVGATFIEDIAVRRTAFWSRFILKTRRRKFTGCPGASRSVSSLLASGFGRTAGDNRRHIDCSSIVNMHKTSLLTFYNCSVSITESGEEAEKSSVAFSASLFQRQISLRKLLQPLQFSRIVQNVLSQFLKHSLETE
jgi:hypothetical protein